MPSVPRLLNQTSRIAAVLLLGAVLLAAIAEHVSVSVDVEPARSPELVLITPATKLASLKPDTAAQPSPKVDSRGPGGAQPWVPWSYIP